MIHVVFQQPDADVLQQALNLDGTISGPIVQIKDDYAVGPVKDIFTDEGIEARKAWWRSVLAGSDLEGTVDDGSVDDAGTLNDLRSRLDEDEGEVLWIWAAQNKHDVSGYYWLMSQLSEYQGRVFILYLNNLPFFNEKGNIFYPEHLHTIPPKEFLKAKKLARAITPSEFEVDPDEWKKLCNEDKYVRLLEGGKKLSQHDVDFYDAELKKYVSTEWQKAGKIITQFLHKAKHTTGDMFLLWRLKSLVNTDGLEVQGNIKGMKDFEVRKAKTQEAEGDSQPATDSNNR